MRFLVWICRLLMVAVVAAFVATVFYVTHDVGTQMDSAKPALNLVTVIGAGVVGLLWPLMRRYWQALALLISLLVFRGLFGLPEIPGLDLETPLLTPFQSDFLWIPIGVIALVLVVSLVARAIISDRTLRAMKQVQPVVSPAPAAAAAAPLAYPASVAVAEPEPVMAAVEAEVMAADADAPKESKRKK